MLAILQNIVWINRNFINLKAFKKTVYKRMQNYKIPVEIFILLNYNFYCDIYIICVQLYTFAVMKKSYR